MSGDKAGSGPLIYKIMPTADWAALRKDGRHDGAPVDLQDGYVHLSAADQVEETAAKHFGGLDDLMLVALDAARLGDALKWEVSRKGQLFPHLYAPLRIEAVRWARPLPLGPDGRHQFEELLP